MVVVPSPRVVHKETYHSPLNVSSRDVTLIRSSQSDPELCHTNLLWTSTLVVLSDNFMFKDPDGDTWGFESVLRVRHGS